MNSNVEEKELDKLRRTIEEFRAKAERSGIANNETKIHKTSTQSKISSNDSGIWNSPPSHAVPPLPMNKHFRKCPQYKN